MILALDTGGNQLALALADPAADGSVRPLAQSRAAMRHGHGEALAGALEALLESAGRRLAELDLIAVSTGPGGFTGLRVGLAFAGGLALAGGAGIVGIPAFDAIAAALPPQSAGTARLIAIDSRRAEPFVRHLDPAGEVVAERWMTEDAIARAIGAQPVEIAGDAAASLGAALSGRPLTVLSADGIDPLVLARLGHARRAAARPDPPAPLYLRAPDAVPMAATGSAG